MHSLNCDSDLKYLNYIQCRGAGEMTKVVNVNQMCSELPRVLTTLALRLTSMWNTVTP